MFDVERKCIGDLAIFGDDELVTVGLYCGWLLPPPDLAGWGVDFVFCDVVYWWWTWGFSHPAALCSLTAWGGDWLRPAWGSPPR